MLLAQMLSRALGSVLSLNKHFRLRSTGQRVEIVHVLNDDDQTLCMVEGRDTGRIIVREQELELELVHIAIVSALCFGLVAAGVFLGWTINL